MNKYCFEKWKSRKGNINKVSVGLILIALSLPAGIVTKNFVYTPSVDMIVENIGKYENLIVSSDLEKNLRSRVLKMSNAMLDHTKAFSISVGLNVGFVFICLGLGLFIKGLREIKNKGNTH